MTSSCMYIPRADCPDRACCFPPPTTTHTQRVDRRIISTIMAETREGLLASAVGSHFGFSVAHKVKSEQPVGLRPVQPGLRCSTRLVGMHPSMKPAIAQVEKCNSIRTHATTHARTHAHAHAHTCILTPVRLHRHRRWKMQPAMKRSKVSWTMHRVLCWSPATTG